MSELRIYSAAQALINNIDFTVPLSMAWAQWLGSVHMIEDTFPFYKMAHTIVTSSQTL